MLQKIDRRWSDFCIVAAPGPSLTSAVAEACRGFPVIVVNDAHRLLPFADVLYAADGSWWRHYSGCTGFAGERWSSHGDARHNDKRATAAQFGLRLVRGRQGDEFSTDPAVITYGENSGFQAVNFALHAIGFAGRVALVGFDMRPVAGRLHFFGNHPEGLRNTGPGYSKWPGIFARAAKALPDSVEIVNCTPGSALTCFRMMDLSAVLADARRKAA